MSFIQQLAAFTLRPPTAPANGKTATALLKQPGQQVFEIILAPQQVLAKHVASAPLTVLCLSGVGSFHAGETLDDTAPLSAGVLLSLPANIPHEVRAETTLHLLVSKFG